MSSTPAVPPANHLLAALPAEDRQRLLADCEPVEFGLAEVLSDPGEAIRHVYFPTEGSISLVMPIDGGPGLEVGSVGNEGMLGITLMLGVDSAPFQALARGKGAALRIAAAAFLSILEQRAWFKTR